MGLETLVAVVVGLVVAWLLLVGALWWAARRQGESVRLREVLRLVPDVMRLFKRLASDPSLPRGVRWRMGLLAAYLLLPFDLIPDFLPVVGWADDAVVVVWGLRWVTRAAGPEAVDRHWPGTPEGLQALKRLVGAR